MGNRLISLLLVVGLVNAQPESTLVREVDHARRLLRSTHLTEKAWGAHLAARLHSEELKDILITEFRSAAHFRNSPYLSEEQAFITTLFDAAIEAGFSVPAEFLEPFEEGWTPAVLILLARDKRNEDALLRLRNEKFKDLVWLTANNLLLYKKSKRWYEALLRETVVTHRFVVVSDLNSGFLTGSGSGGGSCGDGVAAMPRGFPPVTLYTLRDGGLRETCC